LAIKDFFLLENKKTPLEALLFYFISIIIALAILNLIPGHCTGTPTECRWQGAGEATGYCLLECGLILYKKNLLKTSYALLLLLTIMLGLMGGLLLALIPASYLTTKKAKQ